MQCNPYITANVWIFAAMLLIDFVWFINLGVIMWSSFFGFCSFVFFASLLISD